MPQNLCLFYSRFSYLHEEISSGVNSSYWWLVHDDCCHLPPSWRGPVVPISHPLWLLLHLILQASAASEEVLDHQEINCLGQKENVCLKERKKNHQTVGAKSKKAAYTCKSGSLYSVVCVHTLFQEPSPFGCHHSRLFAVCVQWRAWNITTKMCILVNRYSLGWLLAEHKALLIESGIWQGCIMIHFGC